MDRKELEERERRSMGLRWLAVVVTVVLLVVIVLLCINKVERRHYREAYETALALDRQKRLEEREEALALARRIREQQIADSIKRASLKKSGRPTMKT